uniref:hypothetical protein n=1 Tax=Alcaligenes xylosoxydans xylosoxydans TaxID=85698 RepID=UPI001F13EED6
PPQAHSVILPTQNQRVCKDRPPARPIFAGPANVAPYPTLQQRDKPRNPQPEVGGALARRAVDAPEGI